MEDVLRTYELPYSAEFPVVCMDEASKQLFGEVESPQPASPGKHRREDYEYERKGTCNQFMFCEPLRGWRHVIVSQRRTMQDWALAIRELVDNYYPTAKRIRLVLDNLNTHMGTSLYATFAPNEARRLLDRLEFHYTPKHASWLNMAEIEIGVMNKQCLNRRLAEFDVAEREIHAWEKRRNKEQARIHWTFTVAAARNKLARLYPSIEDG